ncbi:hypothetical protein [Alkaliphilus hydrothermalis]|uniref:Uncharacterized protein n=1 Tax=Alkaliphilus hydrothermalis TaxID=1482730 RepID=A0ABS2NS13_9FIRM|nr:hypothetical protein [Alkaliphilus hydrothermalis]MBM7615755.1 hypothetical protein [Alkaliphilus hydrothermalis]
MKFSNWTVVVWGFKNALFGGEGLGKNVVSVVSVVVFLVNF